MRVIIALILLIGGGCGDLSESGDDDDNNVAAQINDLKQYASDTTNLDTHTGFSGNGISVIQLAESILNKYDQDRDKVLDVNQDSFLRKAIGYEAGDTVKVIKTESRGLLFTNADKEGNKDGRVSKEELLKHLEQFDENHDSEITTGNSLWEALIGSDTEWDKFEAKYEERYSYKQERVAK
jgi:hypothetical protein